MKYTILCTLSSLLMLIACADYDMLDHQEPNPVNLEITAVADSNVSLRWTQSDAPDFRRYKVYYSTNDVVDTTQKVADSLSFRQDTTKVVKNLDPNKHYYFRVIVITTGNFISASNTVDTTTLRSMKGVIDLLQPENVSDTSVTLRWRKVIDKSFRQYTIHFDTNKTVDTTDSLIGMVRDDTTYTISTLKRNKQFWFRVFAKNDTTVIASSNTVTAITMSGQPKASSLKVMSFNDTSASLRWIMNNDSDFISYLIYFDTIKKIDSLQLGDSTSPNIIKITEKSDTLKKVTPLNRNSKYYFTIITYDNQGLFSFSNQDSCKTPSGLPDTVTLSSTKVTDTSVTLQWTQSKVADFSCYKVFMDSSAIVDTSDTLLSAIYDRTSLTYLATGLQKEKQYWFAVYVRDSSSLFSRSNIVVNYPVILFSIGHTDSTIDLGWSVATTDSFMAYKLYRDTVPNVTDRSKLLTPNGITNKIQTNYNDTGLKPGTNYFYRMYLYVTGKSPVGSNVVGEY